MSKVQYSKCQTLNFLRKCNTVRENNGYNQHFCNSENAVDIPDEHNSHNLAVSTVNASNTKVSTYSEKLVPFNKRKSQYSVCEEGVSVESRTEEDDWLGGKLLPFKKRKSKYYVCEEDECVVSRTEEDDWLGDEMKMTVKVRTLRSIYRRTKPITSVQE